MWALVSLNRLSKLATLVPGRCISAWPVPADLATMSPETMHQWCHHPILRLTMPFLVTTWPLGGTACQYATSFVRLFVILQAAAWTPFELAKMPIVNLLPVMLDVCANDNQNVFASMAYQNLIDATTVAHQNLVSELELLPDIIQPNKITA